jgi:signal transduction histidine kinase
LSGCVFLWYHSQQRLLLRQHDEQLALAADLFGSNPTPGDRCAHLAQFNSTAEDRMQLALFDSDGHPLCDTPDNAQPLFITATSKPSFSFDQSTRVLTQALRGSDLIIQVRGMNTEQNQRLRPLLAIFLVILVVLTLFYWLQQRLTRRKNSELPSIIQQPKSIDSAHPDPKSSDDAPIQRMISGHKHQITNLTRDLTKAHQFTANVTHELRTPLTILRGESELALRHDRSNDQLRKVLESNLEEINRMGALIDDLLLLSKSELGEIPIRHDLLYLAELIKELQHQSQILAQEKRITIYLDWPNERDIYIEADNLRLRQVFLNLLTNAIRYTREGGTITIRVASQEQDVTISIIDTGIGIEAEHLKHIFECFYRVNRTKNRYDGGSGLGLAIARGIVEAHKGRIEVQSKPGQGSCFCVILPMTKNFDTTPHR